MTLGTILEEVQGRRGTAFLANDPLQFPRRFADPADREVAAVFSAVLAYGRAAQIRRTLAGLFARMPEGPAAFVRGFDPRSDRHHLAGFSHRFNTAEDLAGLALLLRQALAQAGSLEAFFVAGDDPAAPDIGPALASFTARALALDLSAVYGRRGPPADSGLRYLLPSPARGSACKRLCLLLRWLCRPDDGFDLGLWTRVDPARLVVPLDTHIARLARLLGLSGRRQPDWKMALEVTARLRELDPADPVRFDFALSHLGISEGCTGKAESWCLPCPVAGLCSVTVKEKRTRSGTEG